MSIKDGEKLFAKTPATLIDPPERQAGELEPGPKPPGTVADGHALYAASRGIAAYRTN